MSQPNQRTVCYLQKPKSRLRLFLWHKATHVVHMEFGGPKTSQLFTIQIRTGYAIHEHTCVVQISWNLKYSQISRWPFWTSNMLFGSASARWNAHSSPLESSSGCVLLLTTRTGTQDVLCLFEVIWSAKLNLECISWLWFQYIIHRMLWTPITEIIQCFEVDLPKGVWNTEQHDLTERLSSYTLSLTSCLPQWRMTYNLLY